MRGVQGMADACRLSWCQNTRLARVQRLALLLVVGCPLLFFDLGARVLATNDDTRFPLLARDILVHGTWWLPRINGVPHLNKPPLHAWLIAVASWPAGSVTQENATVVSLLAALAVALETFWVGRRLLAPGVAVFAGALVITTYGVFTVARTPLPDMTLCAAITAAMAAYVVYELEGRRAALLVFYLLVGVAFWVKGPAGLLPLAVAGVDTLVTTGWLGLRRLAFLPGLLAMLVLIAPWWAAAAVDRERFVQEVLIPDFLLWYLSPPAWHWKLLAEPVNQMLTILLPWSPLIPFALWSVVRTSDPQQARRSRLLVVWMGTIFLLVAVSQQQRMRYYLPLAPPAALLIAAWFSQLRLRRRAVVFATIWIVVALGLSLWQVFQNSRDNAATDLRAILEEIQRTPAPVYAVDVPDLVFSFYLTNPVVVVSDLAEFERHHGYLIIADRALPDPDGAACRRATGRVNHRPVSLFFSGRCRPEGQS